MALALIAPGFLVVLAGLACYFIKMGENERSGYMATMVLSEIMFLVMLSGILPTTREVPLIMYLFLAYIFILAFLAWWVLLMEGIFVRERKYFESLEPKKGSGDEDSERGALTNNSAINEGGLRS
jgi:hypothetical protein